MRKGLCAIICMILFSCAERGVSAEYSVLYIGINKEIYSPNEAMEISIYNAEDITGYVEIIRENTGDIIYRNDIESIDNFIILSPGIEGEYTLRIYLDTDTYSKMFRVEGKSNQLNLSGGIMEGDTEIELIWDDYSETKKYKVVRVDESYETVVYDNIFTNSFIDVNIKPNKTYRYVLYSDLLVSNELIIDTDAFTSSEFVDNNNNNKLILRIGEAFMYNNGDRLSIDSNLNIVPVMKDDRVILPIRAVVETMGGSVFWNSDTRTVELQAWGNKVDIPVGKNTFTVNGVEKQFDVAAEIRDGRTFVPVRHVESLGCEVIWNGDLSQVLIKYR